jgi:thiamine-monophosphate kinase
MTLELSALAEVRAIDALIRDLPRRADQLNKPHEADAELVPLGPDTYLATTIDCVGDELTSGIYRDPFTAGWVLVMASLSDLAAVGAMPIGLVQALSLPPDPALAERIAAGVGGALTRCGAAMLGGDLNTARTPLLTACAIGLVHGRPVTRMGIQPGDQLWATGPLGSGSALATARLMGLPDALYPEAGYRPVARVAEGQRLRPHVRAMIDTSDGPVNALDHLARLNGVGLRIDFDVERLVEPGAIAAFKKAGLPLWPLLCGEHGEYELIVAAAPEAEAEVLAAAPDARRIALATADPGVVLLLPDGREVAYDASVIRNLSASTGGDWRAYVSEFQAYGVRLGLGT